MLLDCLEQRLILHVDSGVLVPYRVDHLALRFDLLDFSRVCFGESLRRLNLIRHVKCVVLPKPADGCSLNPCSRLWLNFLGSLVLHLIEASQGLKTFDAFELLRLGHDYDASLLMNIHE